MNNSIIPNYTNISDMPGINGLILRLEEDGITFGNRLLHKDGEETLIVLGSFFREGSGIREYDDHDNIVNELDYVSVILLLAIGEKAVMWTSFAYLLDDNKNFKDYYSFDTMFAMAIWQDHEYMIKAKKEFVKASCDMEINNEIFEYPTPVYTDRSFRYTAVRWINCMFGRQY